MNKISWPISPSQGQIYESPNGKYWVYNNCMWVSTCCQSDINFSEIPQCGEYLTLLLFDDFGNDIYVPFKFNNSSGEYELLENDDFLKIIFNNGYWELHITGFNSDIVWKRTEQLNLNSTWETVEEPNTGFIYTDVSVVNCGSIVFMVQGNGRDTECSNPLDDTYYIKIEEINGNGIAFLYNDAELNSPVDPGLYLIDISVLENSSTSEIILYEANTDGMLSIIDVNPCGSEEPGEPIFLNAFGNSPIEEPSLFCEIDITLTATLWFNNTESGIEAYDDEGLTMPLEDGWYFIDDPNDLLLFGDFYGVILVQNGVIIDNDTYNNICGLPEEPGEPGEPEEPEEPGEPEEFMVQVYIEENNPIVTDNSSELCSFIEGPIDTTDFYIVTSGDNINVYTDSSYTQNPSDGWYAIIDELDNLKISTTFSDNIIFIRIVEGLIVENANPEEIC